jgi:hypothetical protein
MQMCECADKLHYRSQIKSFAYLHIHTSAHQLFLPEPNLHRRSFKVEILS